MEKKMPRHLTIFKDVLARKDFSYTGLEMSQWSGISNSQISRFLNGKSDIASTTFFQLLESMPTRFKDCYWAEFHKEDNNDESWYSLVNRASDKDIGEILAALAKRYTEDSKKSLVAA
jgi:hypothetical protein